MIHYPLGSPAPDHPLVDGSQGLRRLTTVVFLDLSGAWNEAPDDAYDRDIPLASGQTDLRHIASTLAQWHRPQRPGALGVGDAGLAAREPLINAVLGEDGSGEMSRNHEIVGS